MGVVHGLQGNARVIAIEVAVLDEIFDCIDDLFEPCPRKLAGGIQARQWDGLHVSLLKTSFEHFDRFCEELDK